MTQLQIAFKSLLIVSALMIAILAAAFGPTVVYELSLDRRAPIVSFGASEAMGVVTGDYLVIRYYRKKVRDDCPITSIRGALNENGERFDVPDAVFVGGRSSDEYVDVAFDVSRLPDGLYLLEAMPVYSCPGLEPKQYPPVLTPFRIDRSNPQNSTKGNPR